MLSDVLIPLLELNDTAAPIEDYLVALDGGRACTPTPGPGPEKRARGGARLAIGVRHNASMEDVASVAHAAIVKRDWGALQPLLHPYLHWVQADGRLSVELGDGQVCRWYVQ